MAQNVFDQFDPAPPRAAGNPFDQFDAANANVAPNPPLGPLKPGTVDYRDMVEGVEVHPEPVPSLLGRMMANFGQSAFHGTNEAVLRNAHEGMLRDLEASGQPEAAARYRAGQQAQDAADAEAIARLPAWNRNGVLSGIFSGEGPAALAGAAAGDITNVATNPSVMINEIPGLGWVGSKLFGKAIEAAAPIAGRVVPKIIQRVVGSEPVQATLQAGAHQAVAGTIANPLEQEMKISTGLQDKFSPEELALAPAMGFVIGSGLHGSTEMLRGAWDAFHSWRARNIAAAKPDATAADLAAPPTAEEVSAFGQSPEMEAFRQANAVADPTSPLALKLEQRVQTRRAAEAHPLGQASRPLPESDIVGGDVVPPTARVFLPTRPMTAAENAQFIKTGRAPNLPREDVGASVAQANAEVEARRQLAAELEQGASPDAERDQYGILQQGRDPATVGLPQRPALPDVIPVTPGGQADVGGLATEVGRDKFGARAGLPAIFQPDSASRVPMTPEEIAHRQRAAQVEGQQIVPPIGEPGRLLGSEDRLPQTPEGVQGQTQAQRAFALKQRMSQRVTPESRDVSAAGRPEGPNEQPITVHQGFPVKVASRRTVRENGRSQVLATVQRVDPRTGEHVEGSVSYEAPAHELWTGSYAKDPRMAQDVAARSEGPLPPETPRGPDQGVGREPRQTYRSTAQDPNEQFPGAGEGRSPMPEQPAGLHPGRERATQEDEAIRDYQRREQARKEGRERQYDQGEQERGPRPDDNKTSTKAKAPDKDGRYEVDDRGFVASDKGGPLKFGDQKQAAKWIINEGHKKSPDQIFEIENHPSGKGFGVRERGRTEPPKGDEPPPTNGTGGGGEAGARSPGALPPPKPEPKAEAPKAEAPKAEAPKAESPHLASAREDVQTARGTAGGQRNASKGETFLSWLQSQGGFRLNRADGKPVPGADDVRQIIGGQKVPGLLSDREKSVHYQGQSIENGKTPAQMAALAEEAGWIGTGHGTTDHNDFNALLDRQMRGEDVRHPDYRESPQQMDAANLRSLDEEMHRAGIDPADSEDIAAQKLADYRDKADAEFAADQAKLNEDFDNGPASDEINPDGWQYEPEEPAAAAQGAGGDEIPGWEAGQKSAPESQAGAGPEQPGGAATGGREASKSASESQPGGNDRQAGGPQQADRTSPDGERSASGRSGADRTTGAEAGQQGRKPDLEQTRVEGTEHEATEAELRQRQAKRKAEEKQQNPRAFKDRVQKGHADEGLFGDQSEKAQEDMFAAADKGAENQGTPEEKVKAKDDIQDDFFSNPIGDPRVWRKLGSDLKDYWGWAKDAADHWVDEARKNWADIGIKGPGGDQHWARKYGGAMASFLQSVATSSDSSIRTLGWSRGTKVLGEAADLLHVPTKLNGVARKESYFEAVERNIGHWGNRVDDALAFTRKMKSGKQAETLTQIRNKITNPSKIKRGNPIDDAAHEITKVLAEIHPYLKDAGIDLGKVLAGYFPRVTNDEAIMRNPSAFRRQAIKAYMDAGLKRKDAELKADDWIARVNLGDHGVKHGNEASSHFFTEARSLPKSADETLKDFLLTSPADVMSAYVSRAVRKAEYARRFGKRDPKTPLPKGADRADFYSDPNGKMTDFEDRLIAEGNADLVETLRNHIQGVTGNFGSPSGAGGKWRAPLSWAKTWTAISFLPKSIVPALSEPIVQSIQTGNTLDAAHSLGETVRQWVPILRKMGDGQYWRDFAEELGYVRDAHDSSVMMARANAQSTSVVPNKIMQKFYLGSGVSQLTEATKTAAVKIGTIMIRRLAKDINSGGVFKGIAGKLLADLGVPTEKHAAFSKWVLSLDKPKASDIRAHAEHGQDYQTALSRFVGRSVQTPNAAVRPLWTQHPLGSVVFGLQSFNYSTTKNVIHRVGTMAGKALNPLNDLNPAERAFCMMPLVNTIPLMAASYAAYAAKDALFQDPARKQKPLTGFNRVLQVASRAGMTGMADAAVNMYTSVRYTVDPLTGLSGPTFKSAGQAAGHAVDWMKDRHNPNTQRKLATDAYNMVVEPGLIGGLAFVNPMVGVGSRVAAVGMNYFAAHPQIREHAFVRPIAGKRIE